MNKAPRSSRLQIGVFGRTNVGKSSFLNMLTGQSVSITSEHPGTTTDVVEKQMELLPLGPVLFFDTGGLDDSSILSEQRISRTWHVVEGIDLGIIVTEPGVWGDFEKQLLEDFEERGLPVLLVINKIDQHPVTDRFKRQLEGLDKPVVQLAAVDSEQRDKYIRLVKLELLELCPADFLQPPTLVGDLLDAEDLVVLVVPLDLEAPKDRIILPQVQTIRNALDSFAAVAIVRETGYRSLLNRLKKAPKLVICDSQVVADIARETEPDVALTTFSILFARRKGDLPELAAGAAEIERLKPGDAVLIAEACSHHPVEEDIGRVKIPRWLDSYVGGALDYQVYAGTDFPNKLEQYSLIIHCGGCMTNRRRVLYRIQRAGQASVPITNYGICIAAVHGLAERVLAPFDGAVAAYRGRKQLILES